MPFNSYRVALGAVFQHLPVTMAQTRREVARYRRAAAMTNRRGNRGLASGDLEQLSWFRVILHEDRIQRLGRFRPRQPLAIATSSIQRIACLPGAHCLSLLCEAFRLG